MLSSTSWESSVSVLEQKRDIFEKYLREYCSVSEGDKGIIAVSGGGDSTLMLHLFSALRQQLALSLHVVCIDHGLRPSSAIETEWVHDLAKSLELPFTAISVDVRGSARREKKCLEEAGRDLRRQKFEELALAHGADWIALAHTSTDQAETVLMRIRRGTGLDGLVGMSPRHGPYIRPLLWMSRGDVRATLRVHQLSWLDDESNSDNCFERARLRHELLPLLFEDRLLEIAAHSSAIRRKLTSFENSWELTNCHSSGYNTVIERSRLLDDSDAITKRLIRHSARSLFGERLTFQRRDVEKLLELAKLEAGRAVDLHRCQAHLEGRQQRFLVLERRGRRPKNCSVEITSPGRYRLDGLAVTIVVGTEPVRSPIWGRIDGSLPIIVRGRLPGDRLVLNRKKLKGLWEETRAWKHLRDWIPLVVRKESVLWTALNPLRSGEGMVLSMEFDPSNPLRSWMQWKNRAALAGNK